MKELNLVKILKDCPKGTKLYSPCYGELELANIYDTCDYQIKMLDCGMYPVIFSSNGKLYNRENAECMLFPSKENRDWNTFKVSKPKFDFTSFKPFDKVLVRDDENTHWKAHFFSNYTSKKDIEYYGNYRYSVLGGELFEYCIPYNDDTKHLVGTNEAAPEFYRV